MKIAPLANAEELEGLRARLAHGIPVPEGYRVSVMIYKCRWGWVVRTQLRRPKAPNQLQRAHLVTATE